jgi:outer membrane protein assembly factor BamB
MLELGPLISSPVIDGGILYAATLTGRIFAVHIDQRQLKWHLTMGSPIVSSPLLHENLLIAASFDSWVEETGILGKNQIYALNTKDGKPVWSFDTDGDIFSSPCIAQDIIVIGSLNQSLLALDIYGSLKWTLKLKAKFGPPLHLMETIYLWALTMVSYTA